MKLSLIQKFARRSQEGIITGACAEYYEKEGGISDNTIDILNQMLDNLEVKDRDQVLSAITFAEIYQKANFKEPNTNIKYEKAKGKDSKSANETNSTGTSSTSSGSAGKTKSSDRETERSGG